MSPVNVPDADNEAIPGAPSWRRRFRLSDKEDADSPRSTIGEGDLAGIRRRYSIPESVKLRCAGEFERAPDGGLDEVAIFEAYFEVGSRGGIPSLIAEMSSYFAFSPSQLTPSTWRTLIAIQVLGELQGIPFGISEVQYSYSLVPLKDKKSFYQIWSRDGEPIVNEPHRGVRDVARPVSFAGEALVKLAMEIPKRFRWIPFLVNQATLSHHSRVWGEISYLYLAIRLDLDRVFGPCQRILPHEEILFLRAQLRNMASHQACVTHRTRAFARWELIREWLEKNVNHQDLDGEYR
ncbi:hypothetical protein Bca101_057693 [Brassica carinata]